MVINQTDTSLRAALARIERKLATMATTAEMEVLFGQIHAATDDIAADLAALMSRAEVPQSVRDATAAISERLTGIASAFPAVPVPPGSTPGSEPLPV